MESKVEKLLSAKEVGEILGFRRSKVHQILASGELPVVVVSQGFRRRVFRVRVSALARWIAEREVQQ